MTVSKPKVRPSPRTRASQEQACDPERSIWVSANAGSGKTHVLTHRVLRLLLTGVAPENILCLTYTKAAAAEMKSRITDRLAAWTISSKEELAGELGQLLVRPATPDELSFARTLFARALETPGGLKINTIHAFCEASLHRFPLEAGVPVNFSVIEGAEQTEMVRQATEHVLSSGLKGNPDISRAVAHLFSTLGDSSIHKAINGAMGSMLDLRPVLEDVEAARMNLCTLLELEPERTEDIITREMVEQTLLDPATRKEICDSLAGECSESSLVGKLSRHDSFRLGVDDLVGLFLTKGGTMQKRLLTKPQKKAFPQFLELLEKEQERVYALAMQIRTARLIRTSHALLDVVAAIWETYEARKAAADKLDFDDLIAGFRRLLSGTVSAQWVHYKLDSVISHVLVDEAQDTNPGQWDVIGQLLDDFFAGHSAANRQRTVFGVGDEKQSIYGFQGARPEQFDQIGMDLQTRARNVGMGWERLRFPASFRTLENILQVVDRVCADPDIRAALLSQKAPIEHESARVDRGGSVTLWPPIAKEKAPPPEQWPVEPLVEQMGAERQLAHRIVAQIRHWIDSGRPLAQRGRPVEANDILILVQRRSNLFAEIIRALKMADIPTPGADKLPVSGHVAVRDLLALGDVMLNHLDDLTLATVLRSPLFDVSLDQIETLCVDRDTRCLWDRLRETAQTEQWAARAHGRLLRFRALSRSERPYEFFAHVLFADRGRKRFHARLGSEVDDVLDNFMAMALAHETEENPSLHGFIARMRASDISVKRELSGGNVGVRVMTVHGAKGLEAPIVILADATDTEQPRGNVYFRDPGDHAFPPVLAFARDKELVPLSRALFKDRRDARERAEYWRKLYVAMTRAEDELYVTGVGKAPEAGAGRSKRPSWYEMIHFALNGKTCEVPLAGEEDARGQRYPRSLSPAVPLAGAEGNATPEAEETPQQEPPSLSEPQEVETITPSTCGASSDAPSAPGGQPSTDAGQGMSAEQARVRGTVLHRLLQYLPEIAPADRQDAAGQFLQQWLSGDIEGQEELAARALSILSGADADRLFGSDSRAEVPFLAHARKNGKPVRISGTMDRVIIADGQVLVVDFKSNAHPPARQQELSAQYRTQMGLYLKCAPLLFPRHSPAVAIYWTRSERLMHLDPEPLLAAVKDITLP